MFKQKRAKKYCAVFNCLNTDCEPNLTLFKLPNDDERCRTWLKLIDREDLLKKENLNKASYYVCSEHFNDSSFKIIRQLKDNALPSISLHNQPQEGSSCSQQPPTSSEVKSKQYATVGTQTESNLLSSKEQTETPHSLTEQTPRKRKLSN
ncbi:52 kDa repressor of the inhibitor of the protein kinase-like [Leguminivora glycinivorella]|uniref:52 kDa repressor of the inhibitor of the protein kinase-like n=1 Tax=Leguminivora glycinivorella TaxID=1035111 RepID=UPI00200D183A|nr:52 kDa repressor of the inhibitor of the protein kinase-like [Leguminivora glycinivorella]